MSANAGLFPERVENAAQERIAADRNSKSNSVSAAHPEAVRGSVPSAEWPESLRVFGCLARAGARGCTEAGVRKASKEESARVFAPAAVSVYGEVYGDLTQVYGDLTRGSELHVRAPTRTPGE